MTPKELSEFIDQQKDGKKPYPYDNNFTIFHHVRTVLYEHVHITDEHILECCAKATNYEEFIELCRPIAITDSEDWNRERNKPLQKGRTRRRFR